MQEKLQKIKIEAAQEIERLTSLVDLEETKARFLGKKGVLTDLLRTVGQLSPAERPSAGQLVNAIKVEIQGWFDGREQTLSEADLQKQLTGQGPDLSLPGRGITSGRVHPLEQICREVTDIFQRLGFSIAEGPDIETDFYNFEALNIPADHPARDMHDTFYLTSGQVLRTHTSPVQVRVMERQKPPLKIIVPGNVYRCDSDITHSALFHQIEGLYVNKEVTFADLKGTLAFFLQELFGKDKKVRFRPSFFSFTEPSAEVDVQCVQCAGAGCKVCKQTGWLEIMGCGMVNRNVFRAAGYNPDEVTGFAFGMGIERIAMLKFGIADIRLFFENDLRFLRQF